jgi:hypothetical protein
MDQVTQIGAAAPPQRGDAHREQRLVGTRRALLCSELAQQRPSIPRIDDIHPESHDV